MLKKLIAICCAVCLAMPLLPVVSLAAEDKVLSEGSLVVKKTAPRGTGNFGAATEVINLTDGNLENEGEVHTIQSADPGLDRVALIMDLGSTYYINQVNLYPVIADETNMGNGRGSLFPMKFRIDVCDNDSFTSGVTTIHDTYASTRYYEPDTMNVTPHELLGPSEVVACEAKQGANTVTGRYIRILMDESGIYYWNATDTTRVPKISFREVEVLGQGISNNVNLASGKPVDVTGTRAAANDKYGLLQFTNGSLNDFQEANCGEASWTSATAYTPDFTMDLGDVYTIYEVMLYPTKGAAGSNITAGSKFPRRFRIDVARDPEFAAYETFYVSPEEGEFENNTEALAGPQEVQAYTSENGLTGRYVRIHVMESATCRDSSGAGLFRPGFAEIEVWGNKKYDVQNTYDATADGVSIATTIENNTDSETTAALIYALYSDEGRLCEEVVVIEDITLAQGLNDDSSLAADFTGLEDGKGYTVKTMLWQNADGNLLPLCDYLLWASAETE